MKATAGKLIYSSCIFSSMLGVLICSALITANKLSNDLTSNIIENQLAQNAKHNHQLVAQLYEGEVHKI